MNNTSPLVFYPYSLLTLALLLAGCVTYQHPQPTEAKQVLKDANQQASQVLSVPAAVQAELLPANPLQSMAAPALPPKRCLPPSSLPP